MTLHQALLMAALQWLTIWTNPNTGEPTYIDWCRPSQRCVRLVEQVVEDIEYASVMTRMDPWVALRIARVEGRLNPRFKSSIGAFGLFQIHPRGPTGRLVKATCRRLSQRECDRLATLMGAQMFVDGMHECRRSDDRLETVQHALFFHRTGRCGWKKRDDPAKEKFRRELLKRCMHDVKDIRSLQSPHKVARESTSEENDENGAQI